MDDKLDELLKSCRVPAPKDNFAERIIRKSRQIEQRPNIWNLVNRICADFRLPEPALSFAMLVIVGFLAGFITSGIHTDNKSPSSYIVSGLVNDDIINNGGLL